MEEDITYEYLQKYGVDTTIITVTLKDNKNQVIFEKFDGTKVQIAEDMETVSLYGVPFQPIKMIHGVDMTHKPYFIAIITEGILQVHDYVYAYTSDTRNLKLYTIIT